MSCVWRTVNTTFKNIFVFVFVFAFESAKSVHLKKMQKIVVAMGKIVPQINSAINIIKTLNVWHKENVQEVKLQHNAFVEKLVVPKENFVVMENVPKSKLSNVTTHFFE